MKKKEGKKKPRRRGGCCLDEVRLLENTAIRQELLWVANACSEGFLAMYLQTGEDFFLS